MGIQGELEQLSLLAVDDDLSFHDQLARRLSKPYHITHASGASGAMAALKQREFDGILLDMDMPEINGLQLLKFIKGLKPNIPVLMLTGNRTTKTIVETIKAGAFDYVLKEASELDAELEFRIQRMLSQARLATKATRLEKQIVDENAKRYEMVGNSTAILKLCSLIEKMKGLQTPILILGESGTGKELIARALNSQEGRCTERPFVAVNCGAIPENLIESELFGHEKGAFTGAQSRKDGKFIAASGGDIFLDEIADLSLSAQAKLLRVLQEREVTRVGSNDVVPINVRVIAATHKDLKQAVIDGHFREDLYYRLAVMTVVSPPLRERSEDIEVLAAHFLKDFGSSLQLSASAKEILRKCEWRGNIRALKNCIERGIILAQVDDWFQIEDRHIQLDSIQKQIETTNGILVPDSLLPETVEDVNAERSNAFLAWAEGIFYGRAYEIVGRNKSKLAERLSRSRDAVHRKLKEVGVGQGADT